MMPSNNRGYPQRSSSNPPHAPDYFDRYFEVAESPCSGTDSIGSRSQKSLLDAVEDPKWFTDCIAYPDEPDFQADPMSVSPTSGSLRMDLSSDMATTTLAASSPEPVAASTTTIAPTNSTLYEWPYATGLDDADFALDWDSIMQNFQWDPTEPVLDTSDVSISDYSDSPRSEDSDQSSSSGSTSIQNDTAGKILVSRMRYFECPMCLSKYSSEPRLSEHLRIFHAPKRFACNSCNKTFQREKELSRHQSTHESSNRHFACSCNRTYTRRDTLLRHLAEMARRPRQAGRHTAVESNPR